MPESVPIAAFIFGAILILVALFGGNISLFGANITGTTGKKERIVAGALGLLLILIGLTNPFEGQNILSLLGQGQQPTITATVSAYNSSGISNSSTNPTQPTNTPTIAPAPTTVVPTPLLPTPSPEPPLLPTPNNSSSSPETVTISWGIEGPWICMITPQDNLAKQGICRDKIFYTSRDGSYEWPSVSSTTDANNDATGKIVFTGKKASLTDAFAQGLCGTDGKEISFTGGLAGVTNGVLCSAGNTAFIEFTITDQFGDPHVITLLYNNL